MTDPTHITASAAQPSRLEHAPAGVTRVSFKQTMHLIRSDIAFRCQYEHKKPSFTRGLRMLRHPGVACVVRYRLQCYFYANRLAPLGAFLKFINLIFYGVSIDERARIGGGLFIGHAVTIMITADVIMGERCLLFHQNTIAHSPFFEPGLESGPVVIGDDVAFGGGACAYGAITVGDRCRIGANSVVNQSFGPDLTLFGVPARIVARRPDK